MLRWNGWILMKKLTKFYQTNDNNSIHTNRYRSIAHISSMENMEKH